MELKQQLFLRNPWFNQIRGSKPKGLYFKVAKVKNPYLRRYIAPDDGFLGQGWNNDWNQPWIQKAAHFFIGKMLNDEVAVYQTIPVTSRAGFCDVEKQVNTALGIIICKGEDGDEAYAKKAFADAIELAATLCTQNGLEDKAIKFDPSFNEYFSKYNLVVNDFRLAVDEVLHPKTVEAVEEEAQDEQAETSE